MTSFFSSAVNLLSDLMREKMYEFYKSWQRYLTVSSLWPHASPSPRLPQESSQSALCNAPRFHERVKLTIFQVAVSRGSWSGITRADMRDKMLERLSRHKKKDKW